MARTRVLIAGAAGRDFHNFNLVYRDRDEYEVVAFTATQIPNIEGRVYPAELAGSLYPDGIPILPESALEQLEAITRLPGPLSYGQLRLHPLWDPLRREPRFETILARLAPR